MKKIITIAIATIFLSGLAESNADALTLSDVGQIDQLKYSANLGNAGNAAENWVKNTLGSDYTLGYQDPDYTPADWSQLTDITNDKVFAYNLLNDTEFFLVKIGNGQIGGFDHFIFKNLADIDWAVISYAAMFGPQEIDWTQNNVNVGRISHVAEIGDPSNPVPEPATMLLFGTGLAGLAGFARRKMQ